MDDTGAKSKRQPLNVMRTLHTGCGAENKQRSISLACVRYARGIGSPAEDGAEVQRYKLARSVACMSSVKTYRSGILT
jgi:hypothetical protein